MASFLRRGKGWQAIVRRKGYAPEYRTFSRKLDAQRWAHAVEERMLAGSFQSPNHTHSVDDLLTWYERDILPSRPANHTEGFRMERLRDALGKLPAARLSPHDCVEYARARLAAGKSSDTVRRELGLLSTVVTSARAFRVIELPANAVSDAFAMMRQLRLLKAPVERNRRLTRDEETKLLGTKTRSDTQIKAIVAFELETAMRRGELARMHVGDIDTTKRTLRIWHSKTDYKTGNVGRTIPLSPRAIEILAGLDKQESGAVWEVKDEHSITRAFDRLCKRLGIDDLRFHDLRHEATSRLFERGFSIEEVATFTGHRDWRSLKRYTHPDPVKLAEKMV